jgi:hypothetical protein
VDGIASRCGLEGPVIEYWWGARFSAPVQTGSKSTQPSIQWVKRPGRDVDHPTPSRLKEE